MAGAHAAEREGPDEWALRCLFSGCSWHRMVAKLSGAQNVETRRRHLHEDHTLVQVTNEIERLREVVTLYEKLPDQGQRIYQLNRQLDLLARLAATWPA